jgi:hypothetical protein
MTLGRITLVAASLIAIAVSGVQLWSLWRTGQPRFRRRRGLAQPNHPFAVALEIASNALVFAAAAALFVWALAG